MKISLISPNRLNTPYPVYPIGLDYVAGAIPERHQVRIIDLNQENGLDGLSASLAEFRPDLVGISIRNIDNTDGADSIGFIDDYRQVIAIVRTSCQGAIVLGGSGFTIFPEALMEALDVDYGIPGDGERISLLLDALENKRDIRDIPEILGKRNPQPAIIEKSALPMRRLFDANSQHLQYYLSRSGMMNLQTKRGCPFHCIYCTYPHIDGGRLRLHDPAEVAQTALDLQKAGAKYLFISDSTFNCSITHSIAVAKAFLDVGLAIPWGAFFAPLAVPDNYFKLMAKAGLAHAEFGTESLSNRMLAAYQKPFSRDDVLRTHQLALDAGLHIAHYIMPGGPGENEETLDETFAGIELLKKAAFFFFCGIRIYPNTPIYDIAIKEGQISKSQNLLSPVFYTSGNLSNELIESKVVEKAAGRINWVTGSGGLDMAKALARMYARGHIGPLWEHLVS